MRWTVFLTVIMVITVVNAARYDDMDHYARAGEAMCYQNGQVVIPFTQFRGVVPVPGFIESVAQEHDMYTYSGVGGEYYDKDYKPVKTSGIGDTILFVSEEFRFNDMINVTLVLSGLSYAIIPMYEDISLLRYEFDCPKYQHACSTLNISVTNCTYDKEHITIEMSGFGLDKYSQVDMARDVNILLARDELPQDHDMMELPVSVKYYDSGTDSVVARIPREDMPELPKSVTVKVTGCIDKLYTVEDYRTCHERYEEIQVPIAQEEETYVCSPASQKKEEQYCTTTLPLQEMAPAEKSTALKNSWHFVKRIVKFAMRIPSIK